jgi:hypothetical protein
MNTKACLDISEANDVTITQDMIAFEKNRIYEGETASSWMDSTASNFELSLRLQKKNKRRAAKVQRKAAERRTLMLILEHMKYTCNDFDHINTMACLEITAATKVNRALDVIPTDKYQVGTLACRVPRKNVVVHYNKFRCNFELFDDSTVASLKAFIQEYVGVEPSSQILSVGSRVLSSITQLLDENAVINVRSAIRGGTKCSICGSFNDVTTCCGSNYCKDCMEVHQDSDEHIESLFGVSSSRRKSTKRSSSSMLRPNGKSLMIFSIAIIPKREVSMNGEISGLFVASVATTLSVPFPVAGFNTRRS